MDATERCGASHAPYNDGGRASAGYKGLAGDGVTCAMATATGKSYQDVYDAMSALAGTERRGARKRRKSSSRTGVYKTMLRRYLEALGWKGTPTMPIGSGCTVHLRADELPPGRLIVSISRHIVAVIDGVIHDTHDGSRAGARCVDGYWSKHAA